MSRRRVVFTEHFLDQLDRLPARSRDRAFGYVVELAAEADPSRVAVADPMIPNMWRIERFDVTISCAVYEDVLRVDALTVRANS